MKVDSSTAEAETAIARPGHEPGDRPADRPGQPPRDDDRGDPGQGDQRRRPPAANRRRSGTRPGAEQVVVERAVVDVADRGRRPEQRHDRRRGRARAARACRGPGRRPRSRASRGREAQEGGDQHRAGPAGRATPRQARTRRAPGVVIQRHPPARHGHGAGPRAAAAHRPSPRAAARRAGARRRCRSARAMLTAS